MQQTSDPDAIIRHIKSWRERALHRPLYPSKTTDPEARDFDRSVELFREGVRACRADNDLATGEKKLAGAYLLDRRCMRAYVPLMPPNDREAEDHLLDIKLLKKLMRPDGDEAAQAIIGVMFAIYSLAGNYAANQQWLALTLQSTETLLDTLKADPSLERNSSVLEGTLTRPRLHACRASIYEALNNVKMAAKEVSAALKLDPKFTLLRAERAIQKSHMARSDITAQGVENLVREWRIVIQESHPDSRQLRMAYGWMAVILLGNPPLGTYQEALAFKTKMAENSKRQIAIYGQIGEAMGDFQNVQTLVRNQFSLSASQLKERRFLDTVPKNELQRTNTGENIGKVKYACMCCQKDGNMNGVRLQKCMACMQVSYCSKECQRSDWKNHKKACKLFKKT